MILPCEWLERRLEERPGGSYLLDSAKMSDSLLISRGRWASWYAELLAELCTLDSALPSSCPQICKLPQKMTILLLNCTCWAPVKWSGLQPTPYHNHVHPGPKFSFTILFFTNHVHEVNISMRTIITTSIARSETNAHYSGSKREIFALYFSSSNLTHCLLNYLTFFLAIQFTALIQAFENPRCFQTFFAKPPNNN